MGVATAVAGGTALVVVVAGVVVARVRRWRCRPVSARTALRVPRWFACVALDAGLPVEPAWRWWTTSLLTLPPAALLVAPALGLLAVGVVASIPVAARPSARRRAERRYEADLPGLLDAVARALRAGASLRQGLADAAAGARGALRADLEGVVSRAGAGLSLAEALDGWGRGRPRPDVLLVVAALQLAIDTGGASARAVDGLAATIRRRAAVQEEAQALSAQARASALVLACAPLVVCGFTVATGGTAADFLLRTPVGLACLAAGLALDAAGGWWMARITRTATA